MFIPIFPLVALTGLLLLATAGTAAETPAKAAPAAAAFELRDQYETLHMISFPTTNVTVMTVADRKGSEQIGGWIAPLKERYAGRIAIAGIADMSQVPGLLRSMVQARFRKRYTYPVMLDWDGLVARGFHYQKDQANVFVIDGNGRVTGQFTGATNAVALKALFTRVDLALSKSTQ
ncbi:MAG: hypothetical protein WAO02_01295 [Verrucomicrobiia bacterium]